MRPRLNVLAARSRDSARSGGRFELQHRLGANVGNESEADIRDHALAKRHNERAHPADFAWSNRNELLAIPFQPTRQQARRACPTSRPSCPSPPANPVAQANLNAPAP